LNNKKKLCRLLFQKTSRRILSRINLKKRAKSKMRLFLKSRMTKFHLQLNQSKMTTKRKTRRKIKRGRISKTIKNQKLLPKFKWKSKSQLSKRSKCSNRLSRTHMHRIVKKMKVSKQWKEVIKKRRRSLLCHRRTCHLIQLDLLRSVSRKTW